MPWVVPGGPPPASPPGPGEPHGGGDGRRRTRLVVAAVVAILALVAGTIAFVTNDDGSPTAATATTSTTATSAPTSTTTAPPASTTTEPDVPPVSDEEFLSLIHDLEHYVEQARGLQYTSDVAVELADDSEFETRLLKNFDDDVDQIEKAEVLYRALGLIAPDDNLIDELRSIYTAGVLGFYDPETNELVVRGTSPSPYVQETIVHELVHALDDQHFELDRPQYDDRKDEVSTGFSAVVEGNAKRIEDKWISEQPADVRAEAAREEADFGAGVDVSKFPEILLFEIGASYSLGEVFVDALVNDGGERAVDGAITDPPDTSEQFLFPPLYEQHEARVEVPPPPADGEVVDDGVVGALFLFGLFTTGGSPVNQSDAFRAVQGWGGDWAVTWTDGDQACVRADFVGDTGSDTDEIESALTSWTDDLGGNVSRVDGRVRFERCDAGAASTPPQV